MESKILQCDCEHKFQDAAYGKGNRVHSLMLKDNRERKGWRCSVCSSKKDI